MPGGDIANALGERGEAIFQVVLTRRHGKDSLFRVHFLGDKWPAVDFVCELRGAWKRTTPYFFVQAKATQRGYTATNNRLRVTISRDSAVKLAKYKAPVYLAGVDEKNERVFIVGVLGRFAQLSSLHTGTELNTPGRRALYDEVRRYWARMPRLKRWTELREPRWD
jgi:hypothetical protein